MPFSLEGFAFFLEAIFLGVYLYGWDRVSRRAHIAAGLAVALSGLASGVFVVAVNAWMNTPTGFVLSEGEFRDLDLMRAFFSPAFPTQALHMALAAYASVAFLVLGNHARGLLKDPGSEFHRAAAGIALAVATVATPLQIVSGDLSAKHIAEYQPAKLAAAEAHFETGRGASIVLGGLVDAGARAVHGAIVVPKVLSFLATGSFDGEVLGLEEFPEEDWPPVAVVHIAFDLMVASGFAMLGLVGVGLLARLRRRPPLENRFFLRAATVAAPLGLVAIEAGWVVTEVGRQPWIISGVMRTADAVTPMPHLLVPFVVFTALYVALGVIVVLLLRAHVLSADPDAGAASP
jgi:cytochrome d ubiquinol oxidase subunit I